MSEDARWLDGNALGGLLHELFGAEMTAAPAGESWALTGSPAHPRGPARGTLAIAAIVLAMVFSVWMADATGAEAVQRGTVLILIGIPVYVITRRTNPSGRSGALC